MAALVVVALFWGNCYSCPQLLAALQAHQPAHGCCHKTKPGSPECQSQVLKSFVKAEVSAPAPALLVAAWRVERPVVVSLADQSTDVQLDLPDLLALHSSFRI